MPPPLRGIGGELRSPEASPQLLSSASGIQTVNYPLGPTSLISLARPFTQPSLPGSMFSVTQQLIAKEISFLPGIKPGLLHDLKNT